MDVGFVRRFAPTRKAVGGLFLGFHHPAILAPYCPISKNSFGKAEAFGWLRQRYLYWF
jgi:hypothetical protein